jgi:hypothetical protein
MLLSILSRIDGDTTTWQVWVLFQYIVLPHLLLSVNTLIALSLLPNFSEELGNTAGVGYWTPIPAPAILT